MLAEQTTEAKQEVEKAAQPTYTSTLQIPLRYISPQYLLTSRPQYQRSCGMSSLVSIFNLHFSTLGNGSLQPITVQQAYRKLNVIGTGSKGEQFKTTSEEGTAESNNKTLHEYLNGLDFGYFTYNETLITWYKLLCRMHGVKGRASIFYKKSGYGKTDLSSSQAKTRLVEGLAQGRTAYIYHAYDHYFCPVGYEIVPEDSPEFVSAPCSYLLQNSDLWVLISESAFRYAPLRIVRWDDIEQDLSVNYPQRYDIRNPEKGIFSKAGCEDDKPGATFHCIMSFERIG